MSKSNQNSGMYWIDGSRRNDDFYTVYSVDSVMGKGVTSTVFRCRNKSTKEECAAKVIQKMGQGKRKKVISSEVEALLQLNHPNIVKMLDIFESVTEVYIVLELAAGGELFDRIVKKGHYSEKEAARVTYQVLSALEYSHGKGIAHRDIKPENILYSSASDDSLIKISDFGFAKHVDDGIMQTFCGTIGYCAPEVVLKKPYSSAVDLWSLGVVLYILLCGYEPFWDESGEVGVTRKIVYGDYEFESPYWDEISLPAKEFVKQLMTVDPDKRPTAKEALLNPWVQGNMASDVPLTATQERIREFNAKRKFKAATNAVVALNKITGGAYSQSQSLSPEK
ncbi:calcium/calmodulin-dependent protein kinase type IV [Folsomia candida]|uniref:Calcium/calmodulin-dependent protein kinase type IV n=1 Tax=Folsomia candida TaxID=158441 RepID=A0A226DA61_FOLCA|nr:calcium/calmodulin-dependent protein kinase type IV [Folsomia candida]XP_021964579.1 calcium/calmodulin-dependent protein kinase type IV [Folsomia candida]OXA41744.1 Calcium/calmodulin-dependent protein kinase type IV [Folsomia candida]